MKKLILALSAMTLSSLIYAQGTEQKSTTSKQAKPAVQPAAPSKQVTPASETAAPAKKPAPASQAAAPARQEKPATAHSTDQKEAKTVTKKAPVRHVVRHEVASKRADVKPVQKKTTEQQSQVK